MTHRLDNGPTQAERDAIRQVTQRLSRQFPELSTDEIEQAVRGKYETFSNSAVRDFVPVLVEQASRRRLADCTRRRQPH
jgi:hypothetical protein